MFWVRIDNRLVHGQIIETWLPYTNAKTLVVANDDLASDVLRQEIMGLAIPGGIKLLFSAVEEAGKLVGRTGSGAAPDTLVLFASCRDARRAFESGLGFHELNVGNLHYAPGKRQICAHVAVSGDDEACLDFLQKSGVILDFRCVPNDPVQVSLP